MRPKKKQVNKLKFETQTVNKFHLKIEQPSMRHIGSKACNFNLLRSSKISLKFGRTQTLSLEQKQLKMEKQQFIKHKQQQQLNIVNTSTLFKNQKLSNINEQQLNIVKQWQQSADQAIMKMTQSQANQFRIISLFDTQLAGEKQCIDCGTIDKISKDDKQTERNNKDQIKTIKPIVNLSTGLKCIKSSNRTSSNFQIDKWKQKYSNQTFLVKRYSLQESTTNQRKEREKNVQSMKVLKKVWLPNIVYKKTKQLQSETQMKKAQNNLDLKEILSKKNQMKEQQINRNSFKDEQVRKIILKQIEETKSIKKEIQNKKNNCQNQFVQAEKMAYKQAKQTKNIFNLITNEIPGGWQAISDQQPSCHEPEPICIYGNEEQSHESLINSSQSINNQRNGNKFIK